MLLIAPYFSLIDISTLPLLLLIWLSIDNDEDRRYMILVVYPSVMWGEKGIAWWCIWNGYSYYITINDATVRIFSSGMRDNLPPRKTYSRLRSSTGGWSTKILVIKYEGRDEQMVHCTLFIYSFLFKIFSKDQNTCFPTDVILVPYLYFIKYNMRRNSTHT